MKNFFTLLGIVTAFISVKAQCIVQVQASATLCYGDCNGTATAYANGVSPITYLWSPSGQTTPTATGLCPGTYTVQITDNVGCTATATCTITQPTPVQATITSYQNPSCPTCCDGFAIATGSGGTPAYSYLWNPSSQATSVAQQLCAGTYTVCVSDNNNCTSCDSISLSSPNSIAEPDDAVAMNIWGAEGIFTLNAVLPSQTTGEIVIANAMGSVVYRKEFATATRLNESIDLRSCSDGLYFVSVVTQYGVTTSRIVNN